MDDLLQIMAFASLTKHSRYDDWEKFKNDFAMNLLDAEKVANTFAYAKKAQPSAAGAKLNSSRLEKATFLHLS